MSVRNLDEICHWIVVGFYIVISYVLSLRGPEGTLIDLGEARNLNWKRKCEYVSIPLYGKFKGETQDSFHFLFSVNVTKSGIPVKLWMERVIKIQEKLGRTDGPAVCGKDGVRMLSRQLDTSFHDVLLEIWETQPSLFPQKIKTEEDIPKFYHVFRS